jgi:hypothetical protein
MPPSVKDDPRNILWMLPGRADFVFDDGMLYGVGRLHHGFLCNLTHIWDVLLERALLPKFGGIQLASELVTVFKLLLHHLELISTTFRKMQITVREAQRVFLELEALLDFEEFYRSRMILPTASAVVNVIGAFTTDLKVCDGLFWAGIPVWLVRPYTQLHSIRVRALSPLQTPDGVIPLDPPPGPPQRTIYTGAANRFAKYSAIAQHIRGLLQFPDPFGCECAKPLTAPPPLARPSGNDQGSSSRRFTPCTAPPCCSYLMAHSILQMAIVLAILS